MSSLPSTSRVSSIRDFNVNKILSKKTYVPNLSISRNVVPKVSNEDNVETRRFEPNASKDKRKIGRPEKNLLPGAETFAPATDTSRSRYTIKSKSKITTSTAVVKKDVVVRDEISTDIHFKFSAGNFSQITSVHPEDLPVSIPRPRISPSDDSKKPISLLMDIFDPNSDESPIFILKTPKYLPALSRNSNNPKISLKNGESDGHKCTMHDLPAGEIGKLQIMKSGRLRLVLGECKFWLYRGVRVNFKEELAFVSVDGETKTGEIINLGNIRDRIIAVPVSVTIFVDD